MTVGSMLPAHTEPEPTMTRSESVVRLLVVLLLFGLLAKYAWTYAIFVVLLLVSITLHELGHYLGARWGGMKPTEFFIGFGPRLFSFRRGDTEYGLKPILLGAYVKVPGMHNLEEVDPADEARTYRAQSYGRRARMVFAGPAMNLLVALVGFCLFFSAFTDYHYDPKAWPEIAAPASGSAAEGAGIHGGDRIVAIDGAAIATFEDLRSVVRPNPGKAVVVTIERAGVRTDVPLVIGRITLPASDTTPAQTVGQLGVQPAHAIDRNVLEGVQAGFTEFGREIGGTVVGIGRIFSPSGLSRLFEMVTGQRKDDPTDRPTSMVGIVQVGSSAVRSGVADTLLLLSALNLALGLFNLLPILPFDGGHLLIATYERIRSRRGKRYSADLSKVMPYFLPLIVVVLFVVGSSLYLDIGR